MVFYRCACNFMLNFKKEFITKKVLKNITATKNLNVQTVELRANNLKSKSSHSVEKNSKNNVSLTYILILCVIL